MLDAFGEESPLLVASQAAGTRVDECRRRAEVVGAIGWAASGIDASRARQRLHEARLRERAAARRLEETLRQRRSREALRLLGGVAVGPRRTLLPLVLGIGAEAPDVTAILATARSGALDLQLLWMSYAALGGCYSEVELDAYLHGAFTLVGLECDILAHALWEMTELA